MNNSELNSELMYELLCSMAMSEQETYKYNDDTILELWDNYWYDVSRNIKRLKEE